MSSSRVGQGHQSPLSSTSNGSGNKRRNKSDKKKDVSNTVQNLSDDEIEMHLKPSDRDKRLMTEAECNAKFQVFEARIQTLMEVLDNKDKIISTLSTKVGKLEADVQQLKESANFLSHETSELRKGAQTLKEEANDTLKHVNSLSLKTIDLEDRSRRDNIVIFGIPEKDNEKPEDTEKLLIPILKQYDLVSHDHDPEHDPIFHRVHRLGSKKLISIDLSSASVLILQR